MGTPTLLQPEALSDGIAACVWPATFLLATAGRRTLHLDLHEVSRAPPAGQKSPALHHRQLCTLGGEQSPRQSSAARIPATMTSILPVHDHPFRQFFLAAADPVNRSCFDDDRGVVPVPVPGGLGVRRGRRWLCVRAGIFFTRHFSRVVVGWPLTRCNSAGRSSSSDGRAR